MVLGITGLDRLKRFDKSCGKLDGKHQAAVKTALGELLNSATLPSGRKLKKVKSRKHTWVIRISKRIRLSFEVKNGPASFGMSGITTRYWTIRSLEAYDTRSLYISRFPTALAKTSCIWSTVSADLTL